MATRTEVSSNHQYHGVKRTAPDALEHEQRLAKRFDLLNIENRGKKRYIPVAADRDLPNANTNDRPSAIKAEDDIMQVEDTPHKVYIHDLDKELADIESDEENPIFLVDIEKHLNRLPQHLLRSVDELKPTANNQMILYSVPSSISVPGEQDKVRKAIEEARARVKERQALRPDDFAMNLAESSKPPISSACASANDDPDAMDVEDEL